MKAQTAVELLVILAAGLIVIGILFVSSYERLAGSQASLSVSQAQAAANDLANAADTVWFEGAGAKKNVYIELPNAINYSLVSGNTVLFRVAVPSGLTDAVAKSTAPLFGSVTAKPGAQLVSVYATESAVVIGMQSLAADPALLLTQAFASNATQNVQKTFNASNNGNSSLDVTAALAWSSGGVNVSFANPSDSYFSLAPGASRSITLNEAVGANVMGSFSGSVLLNASNGEEATVYVVVEVSPPYCPSCPGCPPCGGGGNETVSWFEITTCPDASCTREQLVFDAGNDSQVDIFSTGSWDRNSLLTINVSYPNGTSVPGYPKDVSTTFIGSFSDYWVFAPGAPNGTYTVRVNQSPYSNYTAFNVTC
ncbi:MAG: hypothetical protein NTY90_01635 [Candidatus Micrarchaeota archaeon]|nr:hypothetical protein [Candidatus Micrarchaeota archaeon]